MSLEVQANLQEPAMGRSFALESGVDGPRRPRINPLAEKCRTRGWEIPIKICWTLKTVDWQMHFLEVSPSRFRSLGTRISEKSRM
jgi:hypothetical protein